MATSTDKEKNPAADTERVLFVERSPDRPGVPLFEEGASYDLVPTSAQRWIRRGIARPWREGDPLPGAPGVPAEESAPRRPDSRRLRATATNPLLNGTPEMERTGAADATAGAGGTQAQVKALPNDGGKQPGTTLSEAFKAAQSAGSKEATAGSKSETGSAAGSAGETGKTV